MSARNLILGKIIDYCKSVKWEYKKSGNTIMLKCPFCEGDEDKLTVNVIPNTYKMRCFTCKKTFTLLEAVPIIEEENFDNDDAVLQFIKNKLGLKVETKKDEQDLDTILSFYEANKFSLVPVAHNKKNPIEVAWTDKIHKDKVEWKSWLDSGLNIGIRCGEVSGITVIDIDTKEVAEEIKKYFEITLQQITKKGYHLFFKYEESLPKTRIDEYKMDIENSGGQVVAVPSTVEGIGREINLKEIVTMPKELLELLQSKVTVPRKTNSEKIRENIKAEDFKIDQKDLQLKNNNLEGRCNSSFIQLGGVLRKGLNIVQTEYALQVLNQSLLQNPMERKSITAMVNSLDRYVEHDLAEMAHEILEHIKEVEVITKSDLELAINGGFTKGEAKKRFTKTLKYLEREEKIIVRGKKVELVADLEWKKELINIGVPINFKVPYINDYAHFNWQDMVVIGAKTGWGKTHIAMNILKRLIDQGEHPYYIYSESGGRFAKIALKLGINPDQFTHAFLGDPKKFRLPKTMKRPIIIYDWFRPTDFARTDELFEKLLEKVKRVDGFIMVFMQLKVNNDFFAPNMLEQFPAFVCKYLYEDEKGELTKFDITKIREGKMRGRKWQIACRYDWDSKRVELVEELGEKEKKNGASTMQMSSQKEFKRLV